MSTKTRKLQLFMRALRSADLEGNLARDVAERMARMENAPSAGASSGMRRAVPAQEFVEE